MAFAVGMTIFGFGLLRNHLAHAGFALCAASCDTSVRTGQVYLSQFNSSTVTVMSFTVVSRTPSAGLLTDAVGSSVIFGCG